MSLRLAPSRQVIAGAFCGVISAVAAAEPGEAKHTFNLPRGDAATTLSQFASASRRQIFFLMEKVRGQQTNGVAGEFTPREAIDRMLAGTALVALQDSKTGAFVIKRAAEMESGPTDSPNPQPKTVEHPSEPMKRKSTIAAIATWLAVALAPTQAAETVEPRAPNAADERAVLLSPFQVRAESDNGYTATSALSGGRTDTPLKLTASAVSVMTQQFIQDVGATDYLSMVQWATNVVADIDLTQVAREPITINLRNMGRSFVSRNHFMWYVPSDSYNMERMEFSRGPNGVLFGDGGAGGIATSLTKRARFDGIKTSASLWGTSYGGYRATLDHNQPVSSAIALRFNALQENMRGWRDNSDHHRWGAHLAGTYQFTRRNQFRFEVEQGYYDRAITQNYFFDQASYWDGRTVYDGVNAPSTAGTGVTRLANATTPYWLYLPGTANSGLNDYRDYYQTTGANITLHPAAQQRTDLPNVGRWPYKEWSPQPPDSRSHMHYYTYSAYIDHRFSDNFYVEFGYNRTRQIQGVDGLRQRFQDHRIDVNRTLPGGAVNPNFGKPYADQIRSTDQGENTMDEARVMANYRFDKSWIKQSISAIGGSRIDKYNAYNRALRRINGPIADVTNVANQIRERRYWDQVGVNLGEIPQIPGVELAFVPTQHDRQRKTIDYLQLLSISRLFNDRLAVSLGARRDEVLNYQETSSGMPRTAQGLPQMGAVIVEPGRNPRNVLGAKARTTFSPTSTNAGVVYYVLRDLGVFANYSETFRTPGSGPNLLSGVTMGVSKSKGYDFGLKLELFNGKVSGSASYYTSEQVGREAGGLRLTEINRIWTNLNRFGDEILNYRDTEDVKGTGYEIDLNANPTRDLRLSFNLAFPEASAVNLRPDFRNYVAQHLATWQAGANDPGNPNRVAIQNDINAIQNEVNSLTPGTLFDATYKYTSNVYATYTLPGRWKNVSIGGGANIRGKQKVGNVQVQNGASLNQPYNYLWVDSYYLVSTHVAYRHRFSDKLTARFQLNIANLLDSDHLLIRNFGTYRAGGLAGNPLLQLPNNIGITDPRKFTLSATFDF